MEGRRIYFSGPQRYYPDGAKQLAMFKSMAEAYGFTLVNDLSVLSNNLRDYERIGREHLDNCDIVVADVEFFRGGEPESGVMFEMGMAWAKGKRMVAFSRDLRNVIHRHPAASFDTDGTLIDEHGYPFGAGLTIGNLMYMIPSKMVEGGFEDCLRLLRIDLMEEAKDRGQRVTGKQDGRTVVTWAPDGVRRAYLAGYECFMRDCMAVGAGMKEICTKYNFEGIFPPDDAPGVPEPPPEIMADVFSRSAYFFDRDQQHIRNSNMIIANVNPFHGHEPDSGTIFEAGMCYGLGYDCYCFLADGRPMRERISCLQGADGVWRDVEGYIVEDYGLPVSHKLASCMKVVIGDFEDAARFAAKDLGIYGK